MARLAHVAGPRAPRAGREHRAARARPARARRARGIRHRRRRAHVADRRPLARRGAAGLARAHEVPAARRPARRVGRLSRRGRHGRGRGRPGRRGGVARPVAGRRDGGLGVRGDPHPGCRARLVRGGRPARRARAAGGCRGSGASARWPGRLAAEALRVAAWRRARRPRPMAARCRTRSTGSAPPCTSTRAAIAGSRPSRRCTTWAIRRAAWSRCCSSTAARALPEPGAVVAGGRRADRGRPPRSPGTEEGADRARARQALRLGRHGPHGRDRRGARSPPPRRRSMPPDAGRTASVPRMPRLSRRR